MSSKQLLFYELVTPISKARHAEFTVREGKGYAFAAEVNSVPLMTVEFAAAAHDYPIVFSLDGDVVLPIVVVGIDSGHSLFVNADGTWNADYVPAFIRRYPFVFSASEDGETLTLCIDEAFEGLDRKGREGQRLFDEAGERTPYLERVLEFVNAYQGEHQRTKAFGALLQELDLLEPSQANVTLPDGSQRLLSGFHCISRERLKALPAEKLAELVANDALELIYIHQFSLKNFETLLRKFTQNGAPEPLPQQAA
jgi:hypothetical protein